MKSIRNKHVAHRSKETFSRNFYKEAGLTPDSIKELWDLGWEIFGVLSYCFDKSHESLLQDNIEAFDLLLDTLSAGNKSGSRMNAIVLPGFPEEFLSCFFASS
ncbi:MAG: hypothetical protein ACSHX7_12255 [Luteolibacter sp.]